MAGPLPIPTDPVELAVWVEREQLVGSVARLVPELLDSAAAQYDRPTSSNPSPVPTRTEAEYVRNREIYLETATTAMAMIVELDRIAAALAPTWAAAAPDPVAGASTRRGSAPATGSTCPKVCTCDPAGCDDPKDFWACEFCEVCDGRSRGHDQDPDCPHRHLLAVDADAFWRAHRPAGAAAASPAAAPAPEVPE